MEREDRPTLTHIHTHTLSDTEKYRHDSMDSFHPIYVVCRTEIFLEKKNEKKRLKNCSVQESNLRPLRVEQMYYHCTNRTCFESVKT